MKNLLVSDLERQEMPFTILEGTLGIKVVDFVKVGQTIRETRKANKQSMFINIQPVKEDRFKDPSALLTYTKDPITGIYYGIPVKVYEDGNIKWLRIHIPEHITLNLDNDMDMKYWIVLRMHHDILNSPLQAEINADPKFKVLDPEVEAKVEVDKILHASVAIEKANSLFGARLVLFARTMGIPVGMTSSALVVKSDVLRKAYEEPVKFMEKFNNENREVMEIFSSAQQVGIIRLDPNKGYMFGGITLGLNEPTVIAKLNEEKDLLVTIAAETKRKDDNLKRIVAEDQGAKTEEAPKTKQKEKVKANLDDEL